jgi:hypothetical protein
MVNVSNFTANEIRLMLEMFKNGKTNKRDQKVYSSPPAFYLGIWSLRDKQMAFEDGVDKLTNVKDWVLTEKGRRVAKILTDLEGV